ncbi:hypothetical protein [Roseomonas rosulenta]|uniref:hypothetical protein n=1 Tax=Roseomonas rosulenta TaxID=2748667 RepID=UPI0018E060F8|nr:hypothetical protein [Roseomonas rosulenta]
MTRSWMALPMLALALGTTGCGGGVWANVPQDPGPVAAGCRRDIERDPQVRRLGSQAGGNAENNEDVRRQLLVLLPALYHECMIRAGAIPPGTPQPPPRVTF